jgi:hypothetical protein
MVFWVFLGENKVKFRYRDPKIMLLIKKDMFLLDQEKIYVYKKIRILIKKILFFLI